jgi:hypothetical protein
MSFWWLHHALHDELPCPCAVAAGTSGATVVQLTRSVCGHERCACLLAAGGVNTTGRMLTASPHLPLSPSYHSSGMLSGTSSIDPAPERSHFFTAALMKQHVLPGTTVLRKVGRHLTACTE